MADMSAEAKAIVRLAEAGEAVAAAIVKAAEIQAAAMDRETEVRRAGYLALAQLGDKAATPQGVASHHAAVERMTAEDGPYAPLAGPLGVTR